MAKLKAKQLSHSERVKSVLMGIPSNYPRANELEIPNINVASLTRIAKVGIIGVVIQGVLFLATIVSAFLAQNNPVFDLIGPIIGLALVCVWSQIAVSSAVWVYQAMVAICLIRNIVPAVKPITVAILCMFSIPLFGLPIGYAMDFLMIRAEDATKPTMRWTSFWSKSGMVNLFWLFSATPAMIVAVCLILRTSYDVNSVLTIVALLSFELALVVAVSLVLQINKRIELIVEASQRKSTGL